MGSRAAGLRSLFTFSLTVAGAPPPLGADRQVLVFRE